MIAPILLRAYDILNRSFPESNKKHSLKNHFEISSENHLEYILGMPWGIVVISTWEPKWNLKVDCGFGGLFDKTEEKPKFEKLRDSIFAGK